MPYLSPPTEPTETACAKCKHFGGWPENVGSAAWCLHTRHMQSLSHSGCCSWTAQPDGWVMPPYPGPTPGIAVHRQEQRSVARIR